MRPSGDIEALEMKDEDGNIFKEKARTMINGNIESDFSHLGQPPPTVVNSHWNIVKLDRSIVVADANSWFNATLVRSGQTQGSEQN